MSRYLNNPGEVPPGGYRFTQPETKVTVTAGSWKELLAAVQQHRKANILPIGSNFTREIEEAVCAQAPSNWCSDLDPKRTPEVPREDWPLWARELAEKATPEDHGVGDVIARLVGPVGGDLFKVWYKKLFNRPCGCTERQETLNLQYPLP